MPSPIRVQLARSLGVAAAGLLLIVGGAFAANNIAGTLAPHDETVNLASPSGSDAPEASDGSSPDGVDSSPEPSESPSATDGTAGPISSHDANEAEHATDEAEHATDEAEHATDGPDDSAVDSSPAPGTSGVGEHHGGDDGAPQPSDDPTGDD